MKEERTIEPETFAHLVSSTLYERRFGPYFVEPVIAGECFVEWLRAGERGSAVAGEWRWQVAGPTEPEAD